MKFDNNYIILYNFIGERTLNCSWYKGNNYMNFLIGNSYGHGYLGGYLFNLGNDGLRLYGGITIDTFVPNIDTIENGILRISGVDAI